MKPQAESKSYTDQASTMPTDLSDESLTIEQIFTSS